MTLKRIFQLKLNLCVSSVLSVLLLSLNSAGLYPRIYSGRGYRTKTRHKHTYTNTLTRVCEDMYIGKLSFFKSCMASIFQPPMILS